MIEKNNILNQLNQLYDILRYETHSSRSTLGIYHGNNICITIRLTRLQILKNLKEKITDVKKEKKYTS